MLGGVEGSGKAVGPASLLRGCWGFCWVANLIGRVPPLSAGSSQERSNGSVDHLVGVDHCRAGVVASPWQVTVDPAEDEGVGGGQACGMEWVGLSSSRCTGT